MESSTSKFLARAFEIIVAGNLLMFGLFSVMLAVDSKRVQALLEFGGTFSGSTGATFAVGVMWISLAFALGNAVEGLSRLVFHFRESYIMASRLGLHEVVDMSTLIAHPKGALHHFVRDRSLAIWIVRRTGLAGRAPEDLLARPRFMGTLSRLLFPAWTTDVFERGSNAPATGAAAANEPFGHAVSELNTAVRRVGARIDDVPARIQYDLARSFLKMASPHAYDTVMSQIKRLRVERVLVVTAFVFLLARLINFAYDLVLAPDWKRPEPGYGIPALVFDSIILALTLFLVYYSNQSVGMRIVRMCEAIELELDVNAEVISARIPPKTSVLLAPSRR